VPWGKAENSKDYEYFQTFDFADGTGMDFYNPAKLTAGYFDIMMRTSDPQQKEALRKIYGLGDINSRFEAFREVLRMTPPTETLSPFMPQERLMFAMLMTTQKKLAVLSPAAGIFEFEWGDLRGFQIGLPGKDTKIDLHVFDKDDDHLQFDISRHREGAPAFTQSEINVLVKSIRRAPPPKEPASKPAAKKAPQTKN
jgi:hypothetical protein